MGNAQSHSQRDANSRVNSEVAVSSPSAAPAIPTEASQATEMSTSSDRGAGRKRSREDAGSAASTNANNDERPLRQRRRVLNTAEGGSSSSCPTQRIEEYDAMEIDAEASSVAIPSATSVLSSQQSDEAAPDPSTTPPLEDYGATPPPQLDALRQEREEARRRILEVLGAAPPSASPAPGPAADSIESSAAPTAPSQPASVPASNAPNPLASATIAALLGAMASGAQTANSSTGAHGTTSAPNGSASASPARDETASLSEAAPGVQNRQQPSQPNRPNAIRVPIQPEMISGTSMVVQGALVARTIANRPTSDEDPSPSATSSQTMAAQPEAGSSQPASDDPSSRASEAAQSGASSDASGAPLLGDNLRGAVTLEEQAVMLSRILGIAAAATAASLLNTSESHHVDPSLLQTSLRRPFERMSSPDADRNERWLADWQNSNSASATGSSGSTARRTSTSSGSGPGNGLRGRLAQLSRRIQSGSSASGLPATEHTARNPNATQTAAANANGWTNAAPDAAAAQSSRQQEIIAHLLNAAEREATSQRLSRVQSAHVPPTQAAATASRARSSSVSRSQPENEPTPQGAPRSGLSRLVRSTIGNILHPGRLLSGRHSRSGSASGQGSGNFSRTWSAESATGASSTAPDAPTSGYSLGPNDVAGTLRQVRNGILPDGVPGSFGSFLNHLVRDLMAAVQLMPPSSEEPVQQAEARTTNYFEHATSNQTTSGAEVLDADATEPTAPAVEPGTTPSVGPTNASSTSQQNTEDEDLETQARRDRDFQNGNLSFFRLFRFDPVAPSHLVPCIVVGVRSLNVTERFGEEMVGARAPGPGREFGGSRQQTSRPTTLGSAGLMSPPPRQRARSEGPQPSAPSDGATEQAEGGAELPASRFMLFVSGGRYPPNHPLLTSNPATAGRDLMILMDLLSTMQAMQNKPSTVTQQEIDASELRKIKGCEVAELVKEGKITENMAERCLVCLEDWQDEDDVRTLACRHAFHTLCVDRWMTSSSNTCPMCRRQGVTKDGRRAGDETVDSRRAAQAQA